MRGPRPLPHTSGQGTARKMGPRSKRGCVGRGGSSPRARRPPLHSRTPSSALQAVASAPTQAREPPPAFWTQLTRPDFPHPSRGSVRLPVPVTTGAAGTPRGWGPVRAGRPGARAGAPVSARGGSHPSAAGERSGSSSASAQPPSLSSALDSSKCQATRLSTGTVAFQLTVQTEAAARSGPLEHSGARPTAQGTR